VRKPKETKTSGRKLAARMPFVNAVAESKFNQHFAGDDPAQACLYWARAAQLAVEGLGYRADLQAGTAFWKRGPGWQFGYRYSGQITPEGFLEWHCWVSVPDEGLIVDLSTRFQAKRCKITTGQTWTKRHRLPDWLCGDPDELAHYGARYEPESGATYHAQKSLDLSPWGASEGTVVFLEPAQLCRLLGS
jgi:hypothetical protein